MSERPTPNPLVQLSGSLLLTFRELIATQVAIAVLIVTTIGWVLLALALELDVVEGSLSALRIFGMETTPTDAVRDPESNEWTQQVMSLDRWVLAIEQFVAGATYLLGTLLGLFAVIPLTTSWLQTGRIDMLLAKPLPRARLLAGHVLGVWATAFALAAYLVVAVWLVISFKSGIWNVSFLWSLPVISCMFAVMYGAALFVLVLTRSAALGLIVAYGLIFFSGILAQHDRLIPVLSGTARAVFKGFYHALPNFFEVIILMMQLAEGAPVESWYPLYSSILIGALCYAASAAWFARRDF